MKKKEEEDAKKNPPWWKKYADKYQGSAEFAMGETTPPPSDAEDDEFPKVFNMTNGFQKGGVPTAEKVPTGELFADWPKTEPKKAKTEPKDEPTKVDDAESNTQFPKVFSMTSNTFTPAGAAAQPKSQPKPKAMEEDTWEHWKKVPESEVVEEPKTEVVIEEPPKAPEEPVKKDVPSEPVSEPVPAPEPVPMPVEPQEIVPPTPAEDIQMSEDTIEVIEEVEVQVPVPEEVPTKKPADHVEFTDESAPKPQQTEVNDTVPQAAPTAATSKEPKPKRKSLLNLTEKVTGKSKLKKMKTKKKSTSTVDQEVNLNDQVDITDEKENIANDQGSGTPGTGKVVQSSRKRPLEDHEVEGQHSNYSHLIVHYFSNQYQIFVVVVSVLVVLTLLILFNTVWIAAW